MPWSKTARNQALLLIFVIVPALMFGLGVAGFLAARAVGLGNDSVWIALVLSTVGFAISIAVTFRMGKRYETITSRAK
jgi:Kef-type K+ transport system membrane component KefB